MGAGRIVFCFSTLIPRNIDFKRGLTSWLEIAVSYPHPKIRWKESLHHCDNDFLMIYSGLSRVDFVGAWAHELFGFGIYWAFATWPRRKFAWRGFQKWGVIICIMGAHRQHVSFGFLIHEIHLLKAFMDNLLLCVSCYVPLFGNLEALWSSGIGQSSGPRIWHPPRSDTGR